MWSTPLLLWGLAFAKEDGKAYDVEGVDYH
jgi:hypothetical protein